MAKVIGKKVSRRISWEGGNRKPTEKQVIVIWSDSNEAGFLPCADSEELAGAQAGPHNAAIF